MEIKLVVEKAKNELLKSLKERVESIYLLGSMAVGDFLPSVSDINLLVILKTVGLEELEAIRRFLKSMQGLPVGTPLLMTREQIFSSLDVFPIEFYEIKEKHQCLFGTDVFMKLKINSKNLRHECEHEIKGRILRMRQSFLEIPEKAQALQQLLTAAHNANFPAFRAALRLKKAHPPVRKDETLEALAKKFELEHSVLVNLSRLREKTSRMNWGQLRKMFEEYLHVMEKLATAIDEM